MFLKRILTKAGTLSYQGVSYEKSIVLMLQFLESLSDMYLFLGSVSDSVHAL